ncbi:LytTR family transcriptional regulator [Polaribacter sp. IC073]|nr:LytTR family transcriptional regulator [Polaribacter sp. IC073]
MRSNIQDFLLQLNLASFLKVHLSYVVHKNYVTAFNAKEIKMETNKIPVSQKYLEEVYTILV